MASPFSIFRKNQKVWMAGLVVMAMIAFVFLSGPMVSSRGSSGSGEEPLVKTKFGNLGPSDLRTFRANREVIVQFFLILANPRNGVVPSNAATAVANNAAMVLATIKRPVANTAGMKARP